MKNFAAKGLVALFVLVFVCVLFSNYSLNLNKNDNQETETIVEPIKEPIKIEQINFKEGLLAENLPLDDFSKIAYEAGYKRGYVNFMQQHVKTSSEEAIQYTYTSSEDESKIENDQNYQEIISKGYVDGYHKAGESQHCPRYEYR